MQADPGEAMFKLRLILVAVALALALSGPVGPALAQEGGVSTAEHFWLFKEVRRMKGADCPDGPACAMHRLYTPRRFDPMLNPAMAEVMRRMEGEDTARGQIGPPGDSPKFCENRAWEGTLNFDPEALEPAAKLEVLRDLPGVYFDLTKLKAPEGFVGAFGKNLDVAFRGRFKRAGIRLLTKEQVEATPGQPVMNVYFSHTNPKTGCWYSVFASLTQTALLTRNPLVKFKAGTWSTSSGVKTVSEGGTEYDAILWVADKFVRDYLVANEKAPAASR